MKVRVSIEAKTELGASFMWPGEIFVPTAVVDVGEEHEDLELLGHHVGQVVDNLLKVCPLPTTERDLIVFTVTLGKE